MAKIYANRVFHGKWKLEDVPERWRNDAKKELEKMQANA